MMMTSNSLAWYRAPGVPHQNWDRPCCGSAIRRVLTVGCGSGVIGAGLESRHAPWMLNWSAALVLAGRSRVIGCSGAPAGEVADPGRFAACRSAVPVLSGRSESPTTAMGRLDSRWVNART